jgi:hypothetical protein
MQQTAQIASPAELDAAMHVVDIRAWLLFGVSVLLLGLTLCWAALTTVKTTVSVDGAIAGPDRATLFVGAADGRRVSPGMQVTLTPFLANAGATVVQGQVVTVGTAEVSLASLVGVTNDDAFASSLAARGEVVPLTVRLAHPIVLPPGDSGTVLCHGQVIVEQVRPITLFIP